MERMGYDADTQTYSYRDTATGKYYEGEEGNRYGKLHPGTPKLLPTASQVLITIMYMKTIV